MWFFDYVSMGQAVTAPGDFKLLGKHGWLKYDLESKKLLRKGISAQQVEGSYSSVVTVSFDGSVCRMAGNPSRYGRLDNVFGYTDIDAAVGVFNRILSDLDLPPFEKGQYFSGLGKEGDQWGCTGARFTRLDLTQNMAVGQENERAFIRALGTVSIGRGLRPHVFPNGLTVDWLRDGCEPSEFIYSKVYAKSIWMGEDRKKERHVASLGKEDLIYYDLLKQWAMHQGTVRQEHSFKNKFFAKHPNLSVWGVFDPQARPIMQRLGMIDKAIGSLSAGAGDMAAILDRLVEAGYTARQARASYNVWKDWRDGEAFDRTSSWYVHRNRLLDIGLDISVPAQHQIMYLPRIRAASDIEVVPLAPPDWYRSAA